MTPLISRRSRSVARGKPKAGHIVAHNLRRRKGEILSHNHVLVTAATANGVQRLRWFTVCAPAGWDPAKEEWEVCPCGWRPDLGKHYAKAGHVQWWREHCGPRGEWRGRAWFASPFLFGQGISLTISIWKLFLSSPKTRACSVTITAKGITERVVYSVGPTGTPGSYGDSWIVKFGGNLGPHGGGHKLFPDERRRMRRRLERPGIELI